MLSSDWTRFQAFSWFSSRPGRQVYLSGEGALGRIGAWRGVDRFCLEQSNWSG